MSTLRWRPYSIAKLGLTIDVVEGATVDERDAGPLHVVQQFHPGFQLGTWLGPEVTLAWWRGRFQPTAALGPESSIQVCGRPAHRQEVTTAADTATGGFTTPGGGIAERTSQTPARVHVAVAGTTSAGIGFVVSWVVDRDMRDRLRGDEDHFLASIACS